MGHNRRFGRIKFAIGFDIIKEFKKAVKMDKDIEWKPIYRTIKGKKEKSKQQWGEICFVPNAIGKSKKGPEYRYIAVREELEEQILPGDERICEFTISYYGIRKQEI